MTPSIVVLGMGNLLKSDDGVGIRAIERLQQDSRALPGVQFVDGGTLGLELLQYAWSCSHLLVIDAIDLGAASGTIASLTGEELNSMKGGATVHDLGFADLLAAMRLVGSQPPVLRILGVQPGSTELATELSPQVAAALPELTRQALAQVLEWLREPSTTPGGQPRAAAQGRPLCA